MKLKEIFISRCFSYFVPFRHQRRRVELAFQRHQLPAQLDHFVHALATGVRVQLGDVAVEVDNQVRLERFLQALL